MAQAGESRAEAQRRAVARARQAQRARVRRRRLGAGLVVVALFLAGAWVAWPGGGSDAGSRAADGGGGNGGDSPRVPNVVESIDTAPSAVVEVEAVRDAGEEEIRRAMRQDRPPQFVIASFDGAANRAKYEHWLALADEIGARFSFFVSGVYMLQPSDAERYRPPRRDPGASDIGFADDAGPDDPLTNIKAVVPMIAEAYRRGHEIGTHYNGHFCGEGGVGRWNAADWKSELDQWTAFMLEVNENNGIEPPIELPYGKADFIGGRTPCLEGNKKALYRTLRELGYRYDSSQTGFRTRWPVKENGIWNFALTDIPVVGTDSRSLVMDYNFYVTQSGGKTVSPEASRRLEDQTYRSYMAYFESEYDGTRAPVQIGNHFASWNHGAYEKALDRFLRDVCGKPEVACVSYRQLADFLDEQDPEDIERWSQGAFPRRGEDAATAQ